ncbi:ATP-binding protein [Raineyella sp. LH-20]|uniref:sensor histidine kinase n=1 Tax=Raineyella sp. LH-20 TaxID=3081204 RepID=UPI00295520DD|nr:ATP-binding protein [Raineyella sp. LH-20]WOP17705.1 ATP-binding protein [Raineyella sp. LH-20]
MRSRLTHLGLRAQLALAIVVVTVVGVTASFLALYADTGRHMSAQIDSDLERQLREWNQFRAEGEAAGVTDLRSLARRFLERQRLDPASLIVVFDVTGGPVITDNAPVVELERQQTVRDHAHVGLINAPPGRSSVEVAGVGAMRVLVEPIEASGGQAGVFRVADSERPIERARASLRQTFVVVGSITTALAAVAGLWLAGVIAAPLRRMAGIARDIEAGDMSVRAGADASGREVETLASAFDGMLDRLEQSFTRQRDFVSDASHELRTPLAVLRTQVELLECDLTGRPEHRSTVALLRRLDEIDRLVGDMLTLTTVEAGQLVEPRAVDLDDYFEDLRRDLPLYGDRRFSVEAVGGTLDVDPERLTQVIGNIVRNAVRHTRAGDTIAVRARAYDGLLDLAISDTGPGIPPDQLTHIFQRFHRVDEGRSRDRGGSGLGLAIARAIVEAHGGHIRAESPPGEGATFRIQLPHYHR